VLVVHTLLCPSMLPFLRSRWPLIQYLAKVLRDPRARRFPSKRLLLHHVMQLAQPSRKAHLCPQLCIGYKSETVVTLSKGKSCVKSVLSVTKPLRLLESANSPVSDVQRQVLMALLPMLCLPYARRAGAAGSPLAASTRAPCAATHAAPCLAAVERASRSVPLP
ncbi:unnamed protein product, partial [Prorocentrum cordatum]